MTAALVALKTELRLPVKYKDNSEDELRAMLTPKQWRFALEYIGNGFDRVRAWCVAYYKVGDIKALPEKKRPNVYNSVSQAFSKDSPLMAYLYKSVKRISDSKKLREQYTFDKWFDDTIRLRDLAIDAEQFGPALNAHKMLGAAHSLLTPKDRADVASTSDGDLIKRLEGVNPKAAAALAPFLGTVDRATVIDVEEVKESDPLEGLI